MHKDSNTRSSFLLPLIVAMSLAIGVMLGYIDSKKSNVIQTSSTKKIKNSVVDEVLGYVEAKYVDSVDINELNDIAIHAVLEKLDPHTAYISPKNLSRVNEELDGNFKGIGVQFNIYKDTLLVIKTIESGPSEKAGIKSGDRIIKINGENIAGIGLENEGVFKRLKGEKGSKVDLEILRNNKDVIAFSIERDEIPILSIESAFQINDTVGFVKINSFNQNTYSDFMTAIEPMVKEGVSDIIIDLRQNGGGYLGQATKILNQLFHTENRMLVYTEGMNVDRNEYKTTGKPFYKIDGVVILTDENTASASEIMAGAIQDNDRGHIVGRRTFGKGLVQEQYLLKNGGAMRVTVSKYYTPSGRSIQKPYKNTNYDGDISNRIESGELIRQDTSNMPDSLKYETSEGRIVFGGGGITPDYFIGIDSLKFSTIYKAYAQYLYGYSHDYLEKNRSKFNSLSIDKLYESINNDKTVIPSLKTYIASQDTSQTRKSYPTPSINQEKILLKDLAMIILDRTQDKATYYSFISKNDDAILKGLSIID